MSYNSIVTRLKGGISVDFEEVKDKIRDAYLNRKRTSYRKLAKEFNVPLTAIEKAGRDEGWYKAKRQIEGKVNATVIQNAVDNAADNALKLSDALNKLIERYAEDIEKGMTKDDADKYKVLAETHLKLQTAAWVKSPKDAEEQEARILNLRRQVETESNKDQTIVVQFEGAEAYSE